MFWNEFARIINKTRKKERMIFFTVIKKVRSFANKNNLFLAY